MPENKMSNEEVAVKLVDILVNSNIRVTMDDLLKKYIYARDMLNEGRTPSPKDPWDGRF